MPIVVEKGEEHTSAEAINTKSSVPVQIIAQATGTTRTPIMQNREIKKFPVIATQGHPAEGHVYILETGDKKYVRYENFKTINGPDLYVYLVKDLRAKEFVNLGKLKATEGNVHYEIPASVNSDEYQYAIIWCEDFSVLFNYAKIRE
jgi:hypothetical protein